MTKTGTSLTGSKSFRITATNAARSPRAKRALNQRSNGVIGPRLLGPCMGILRGAGVRSPLAPREDSGPPCCCILEAHSAWDNAAVLSRSERATSLPRGPVHGAAAQEMQMQVRHSLAGLLLAVQNEAIAVLQAKLHRQLRRDEMEMTDQVAVGVGQIRVRRNHLARNDQNVHRRLRVDVVKRQAAVIFVDDLGRNLAVDDLLKDVVLRHGASPSCRLPFRARPLPRENKIHRRWAPRLQRCLRARNVDSKLQRIGPGRVSDEDLAVADAAG